MVDPILQKLRYVLELVLLVRLYQRLRDMLHLVMLDRNHYLVSVYLVDELLQTKSEFILILFFHVFILPRRHRHSSGRRELLFGLRLFEAFFVNLAAFFVASEEFHYLPLILPVFRFQNPFYLKWYMLVAKQLVVWLAVRNRYGGENAGPSRALNVVAGGTVLFPAVERHSRALYVADVAAVLKSPSWNELDSFEHIGLLI